MIIIGEKINGSIPSVAKAIAERDEAWIRGLAEKQAGAQADFIDCCASVKENEIETLGWMIDLIQSVADTPIAVDSPDPRACVEAMKFCARPGLINSVSLEGDKLDIVFPAIAGTKWQCVCLLCDDSGIPKTAEKRLEVLEGVMAKAKQYGISPDRLYFDPLVEMLCTAEDGVNMILEVMREVKRRYPSTHLTAAISNVSFNLPARKLVNQAFAVLAMNAGLDSVILDPLNRDLRGMLYATDALRGDDYYCMEYIAAYREDLFGTQK